MSLQIFSFLSNLDCLNAEGNSGTANPPSSALNAYYATYPFMSISFLCCCLLHASRNYNVIKQSS